MGKQTIFGNIKEWLAGICWHLFLKLNNLTEYEYFLQIKEQELRTDESRPLEKLVMPKIAEDYNVLYHEVEALVMPDGGYLFELQKRYIEIREGFEKDPHTFWVTDEMYMIGQILTQYGIEKDKLPLTVEKFIKQNQQV